MFFIVFSSLSWLPVTPCGVSARSRRAIIRRGGLSLVAPDAIIGAIHNDVSGLAVSGVDLGDDLPIPSSLAGLIPGFVDFHFLFLLLAGASLSPSQLYTLYYITGYMSIDRIAEYKRVYLCNSHIDGYICGVV